MRAVITDGEGGLVLSSVDRPDSSPDGGLVRVAACGLCGSDLEKLSAGAASPAGIVLGHEVVGVLERLGEPPVRVALAHHVPCGECARCRAGHSSLCAQFVSTALHPGGFAEYLAVSALHLQDAVFELPSSVDDLAGTLLEPLSCVLRAVDTATGLAAAFPQPDVRGVSGTTNVSAGRLPRAGARGGAPNVLVAGCGSVGLLFLSVLSLRALPAPGAPLAEARLLYLEPAAERAALAESLGAVPRDARGGDSIDVAFVTAPAALAEVMAAMAPGGIVVVFAAGAEWSALSFDLDAVYRGEITLAGVRSGSPGHLRRARALLVDGRLQLGWFRPDVVGLEELPEAVRRYQRGGVLKVVVRP